MASYFILVAVSVLWVVLCFLVGRSMIRWRMKVHDIIQAQRRLDIEYHRRHFS